MTKANGGPFEEVKFNRSVFDQMQLAFKNVLADYPAIYANADIETYTEQATQKIVIQFRSWLLSKKHQTYTEVPATWWDHFKRDCFPNWLRLKFPPKMRKILIEDIRVCPHSNEKWPDRRPIHFAWMESELPMFTERQKERSK